MLADKTWDPKLADSSFFRSLVLSFLLFLPLSILHICNVNSIPQIIKAYDPNDPGIKAIFSPHSVDPPKEHIKPSWLTPDKIKSPLKGDKDPYYLNEADRSIFHIVPPQEYHLPESQLREMDVICIGSGMAGITAGIMTQWRLKKVNLKVFEKNPTAAGTWYENVRFGRGEKNE